MMKRTIGFLGLLASIMALSSLIYGAFQEPLHPYLQGVIGGVLEVYRLMRDFLFTGLGGTFSGLINWMAQWVNWLPPAPWFNLSAWSADAITVVLLMISSFRGAWNMIVSWSRPLFRFTLKRLGEEDLDKPSLESSIAATFTLDRFNLLFIPIVLMFQIVCRLFACCIFFLLAYAENQIGL